MRSVKPDWAEKGAYLDKKAFYGVGFVSGVKNEDLAVLTAENHAKSELMKLLDLYATRLTERYATSVSKEEFEAVDAKQNIAMALRSTAGTALYRTTITDSWKDSEKGTYHALARLTLSRFQSEMTESPGLDPRLRRFIKKNARDLFHQLKNEQKGDGASASP
jgi:hypothetical protein